MKRSINLGLFALAQIILTSAAGLATPSTIAAEKPLTIVVPFSAGGPADKVALAFASAAKKYLNGQDVVVQNISGGGGTLGAEKVAAAVPDGQTVLLHNIALGTAPALYSDLKYDALRDFEYLGLFEEVPMVLVGRSTLPSGFGDLRYWVDGKREAVTLAHAGIGSASHLCGLLIQSSMQMKMTPRSYAGNGPAMIDIVAGKVDLLCDATVNAAPQFAAGKVNAYGVTSSSRLTAPGLSQLPALNELGMPRAQFSIWFGLSAPRGTPPTQLRALNALVKSVATDSDFVRGQIAAGASIVEDDRINPATHRSFVASQISYWSSVIRAVDSQVGGL